MSRHLLPFFIVLGLIGGAEFSGEAFRVFATRNAPIASGHVIARTPIRQLSVPRVDFTIQVDGSDTQVHAIAPRYLIKKVPDLVRFHYTGDPAQEVFLFDHERNPFWIVLFCWGTAVIFAVVLASAGIQRALGSARTNSHETAA